MADSEGWTTVSGPKHRQRTNSSADLPVNGQSSANAGTKVDGESSGQARNKSAGTTSTKSARRSRTTGHGRSGSGTGSANATDPSARSSGYRGRARLTRPSPRPGTQSPAKRRGDATNRSTVNKSKSASARTALHKSAVATTTSKSSMAAQHSPQNANPFLALHTEQNSNTATADIDGDLEEVSKHAATNIQVQQPVTNNKEEVKVDDDNEGDEDEDDSQYDGSSSDGESENGVEPPPESFDAPVMVLCPFPGCTNNSTSHKDEQTTVELPAPFTKPRPLMAHLETVHGLHVRNLHHMYFSLQCYLDRYAAMMRANSDGKLVADGIKVETRDDRLVWTIDPEQYPDDLTFRRELQREKLNEILQVQEKERREDGNVPRKCLFCKVIPENRQTLFKHMFQEHGFNIGLPDNLVEVEEFLNLLESKLANRQCLYCEKIFTTPAVLRKHMRKKKHFKISARNRIYDKYYVINYLEPGLNWETLEYEKYESDEEHRGDDNWDDWDEADLEPTQCLFCDAVTSSPEQIIEHMSEKHQFDLVAIRESHDLDFYKTVTLINFIRERSTHCTCMACATPFDTLEAMAVHMQENSCFVKIPKQDSDIWKDPKYLFPTVENDPLLMWVDDADETEEMPETPATAIPLQEYEEEDESESDDEDDTEGITLCLKD